MRKKEKKQFDFCIASNRARKIYKTEDEIKLRLEKDKKSQYQLYPLNAFFCTTCNGWHVTRHPVIDGKEVIDDEILAWEQKMSQAKSLSVSVSNMIDMIVNYIKKRQYYLAYQLLPDVRSAIHRLCVLKNINAVQEYTRKINEIEKNIIFTLRHDKIRDAFQQLQFDREQEKKHKVTNELSPKLIQKIDKMIEEAERLTAVNINQAYALLRECQSQIERIKYGKNLSEFKRQWTDRLEIIKAEIKKRV